MDKDFADEIFSLVDLTRIQWVNPITARIIYSAGYKNVKSVAQANTDNLHEAMEKVNKEGKYFNAEIRLRDIKRLVKAASYIP